MESREYFVRVPVSVLMDSRLTRSSVLLYAILIDSADNNGMTEATIDELAAACQISPATVRRSERQLVDAGLLEIYRTGRASLIRLTQADKMLRAVSGVAAYKAARRKEA